MFQDFEVGVPLPIVLLGLLAGGTRAFLSSDPPTLKAIVGTILASVFLAIILYPLLADTSYGKGLVTFLVAIGSITAADSLPILFKLLAQLRRDPLAILREYLNFRASKSKDREGDEQ